MKDSDQLKEAMNASGLKWEVDHGRYITLDDYFSDKPHTPEQAENAVDLLRRVNVLLTEYVADGGIMTIDPDTGTYISGAKGGSGDGGFRLPESTTGAAKSKHRTAQAIDISDQDNKLDAWLTRDKLVKYQLWREATQWTATWCHVQCVPPISLARSYNP